MSRLALRVSGLGVEIARGGLRGQSRTSSRTNHRGHQLIMISAALDGSKSFTRRRSAFAKGAPGRASEAGRFLLTNANDFRQALHHADFGCIHDGWLCFSQAGRLVPTFFYQSYSVRKQSTRVRAPSVWCDVNNLNN